MTISGQGIAHEITAGHIQKSICLSVILFHHSFMYCLHKTGPSSISKCPGSSGNLYGFAICTLVLSVFWTLILVIIPLLRIKTQNDDLENGPFDYSSVHENNLNELEFNFVQSKKYKFSNHLLILFSYGNSKRSYCMTTQSALRWVWWCVPGILVFGRLRPEVSKFKVSQGYLAMFRAP